MASRREDLRAEGEVRAVAIRGRDVVLRRWAARWNPMPREAGVTSSQGLDMVGRRVDYWMGNQMFCDCIVLLVTCAFLRNIEGMGVSIASFQCLHCGNAPVEYEYPD